MRLSMHFGVSALFIGLSACAASPLYTGDYHPVKPAASGNIPRDGNGNPILPDTTPTQPNR